MAAKDLYEKDFYKILGVGKNATNDEIKKKYRSLARELHPDKTKGDLAMEEKFKAVSEAYDILSDSKKRAEYDEARSLFERGGFRAPQGGQNFQGGDFSDIFGGGNPQDIFSNLFGGGARRGPRKGQDLQTGLLLRGTKREDVERGQVVCKPGSITPHTEFDASAYILSKDEGGRHTPFFNNYRPQFYFRTTDVTGVVTLPSGTEMVMPGDNTEMAVQLIQPIAMEEGLRFAIREGGRTVGAGRVTKIKK
jgi:hypothetical protein